MANVLEAAQTYITLQDEGTEISLKGYYFLRPIRNTKKWMLYRRGHRAGGPIFHVTSP